MHVVEIVVSEQRSGSVLDRRGARRARWWSLVLAAVTAVSATVTIAVPDVLRGTAVMNGSARGTALGALALGVPTVVVASWLAVRGSVRAMPAWLGATGFLVYNSFLLLYATPFNQVFLGYLAMLLASVGATVALASAVDAPAFRLHCDAALPARRIAAFVGVLAILNAAMWLARVLPPTFSGDPPAFLDGTGLTTNPVFVNDLALQLPLAVAGAWWLWQHRAWGYVVTGALLWGWVLESLTVAIDQWLGHRADPASEVASIGGSVLFVVLAVVTLPVLWAFVRHVRPAPLAAP